MLLWTAVAGAESFDTDSHKRLAERVNKEQIREYRQVLAEFDQFLAQSPDDSVAAVERCSFIDVFAYAEDTAIEQASDDSERCHQSLQEGPLAASAEVQVFLWQQNWDDESLEAGEALVSRSGKWRISLRARLHEGLSDRYSDQESLKAGEHALEAVELDPKSGHRLKAAQYLVRIGAKSRAVSMIEGIPAEQWNPWNLRTAITTLLGLGDTQAALRLMQSRPDLKLDVTTRITLAKALLDGGESPEAQQLMSGLLNRQPDGTSYGSIQQLAVFEFLLAHGSREDAIAAYRALRAKGYAADRFGRHRLALSAHYPSAPWQLEDLKGVGTFIALLGILALAPALIVVPLHYRGAVIRAGGVLLSPPTARAPWNLAQLWYGLAVLLTAGSVSMYIFCYPAFDHYFPGAVGAAGSLPNERDLGMSFWVAEVACLIALLPLLRGTRARAVWLGEWTARQCVLRGLGVALFVMMASGMWVVINRENPTVGLALGSDTLRAMQGLRSMYGAWGVWLAAAVLTPLVEELIFRGLVLQVGARYLRVWVALILQAGLFMAFHDQPSAYPVLFVMALAAGGLVTRGGGLLAPITLHVANNTLAVLAMMRLTWEVNGGAI